MGLTWGPPGSCRPQMGPMLAPWTLLSGNLNQWDLLAHINGLVQERRNSSALAMELRLSCINPSICIAKPWWFKMEITCHYMSLLTDCPYFIRQFQVYMQGLTQALLSDYGVYSQGYLTVSICTWCTCNQLWQHIALSGISSAYINSLTSLIVYYYVALVWVDFMFSVRFRRVPCVRHHKDFCLSHQNRLS